MVDKALTGMGIMDRRQGSDRPRSARTDKNSDQVNDMVLSQEDQRLTKVLLCAIQRLGP